MTFGRERHALARREMDMSLENVERFEKLLREDEDLQAQVAAASKAYEGGWYDRVRERLAAFREV